MFNNSAVPAAIPAVPSVQAGVPRKKRGWLPLLTVLFLISYGLMTMLIVEQGSTIESQRALIRELFRDSTELSAAKMKAQLDKMKAGAAQNPSASRRPSAQAPSSQSPSPSTQEQQAPSSQAVPKRSPSQTGRTQTGKEKEQFRTPARPATDQADDARAVVTI